MNILAIHAISLTELKRMRRTALQSLAVPLLSLTIYLIVFGVMLGRRIGTLEGVEYLDFIVPGLLMICIVSESIGNSSFGIFYMRFSTLR